MKSTAKAVAILRDLSDKLKLRLPTATIRPANDANGWPMLFVSASGNEAAGQSVVGLRIMAVDMVSHDVFDNSTFAYAPHAFELAYELTASDNPVAPDSLLVSVEYEAFKWGVKMQIKEIANGTAVTETSMNAAAVLVELDDIQWPTKGV